ncbi:hypothetical protein [Nesterenkonia populi]|uniref:hypothetical protein n=1 Tax=Nesterenkonia populi TaxID=1591087 RepID=UPI0011BEB4E6|nr:hypothetical protein [Nesterenkonia populi]
MTSAPPPPPSEHHGRADNTFLRQQGAGDEGQAGAEGQRSYAGWGWLAALLIAVFGAVIAVWQVNERVYTPETAVEDYWEALQAGRGRVALGHFEQRPEFLSEGDLDHVLLNGDPLSRSAELIEAARLELGPEDEDAAAQLDFVVGSENYSTTLQVEHIGTSWGFFDEYSISPHALTWFEVDVPGAPQGGIGQVTVNGAPVNLEAETARLSAFAPTAADVEVDSQWLIGQAQHTVTAEDPGEPASRVTLDLEASEEAAGVLRDELAEFFEGCEQQVLMPSGCPIGTSTPHSVDPDSISWEFPDPEEFELSFDAEGWDVDHGDLSAEVSFDAVHYYDGTQISETESVPFELDIAVGASGEDLIVSVSGSEAQENEEQNAFWG